MEYLYLPRGRSIVGSSGFLTPVPAATLVAVERNRSSSVVDVCKQNFRLTSLRRDASFGNRAGILHYKAGGIVIAVSARRTR